jgi:hypothetical protein
MKRRGCTRFDTPYAYLEAHRDGPPTKDPVYDWFEPVFEKKKDRLHFRPPARGIGQTRIG